MSKRLTDNRILYGCLAALVFFSTVSLAWLEWGHDGPQPEVSNYAASDHAENAQRRIDTTCVNVADTSFAECAIKIRQSERENYRADQDLQAQKDMAMWARFMTFASFLTAGVAAIGLIWIRATLVETRNAVRAADDAVTVSRKIGEAQVRAYLTVRDASIKYLPDGSTVVTVSTINSGQSPAYNVRIMYRVLKSWDHYFEAVKTFNENSVKEYQVFGMLGAGQTEKFYIGIYETYTSPKVANATMVEVVLEYQTVFDVKTCAVDTSTKFEAVHMSSLSQIRQEATMDVWHKNNFDWLDRYQEERKKNNG